MHVHRARLADEAYAPHLLEQLLEQVWGVSFVGETRTVDMHVKTLRRKLAEAAPGSEEAVATVRGVGYRLKKSAS